MSPNQHHTVDDLSIDEQVVLIRRGTSEIISETELRRKLEIAQKEKRPLRVKLGLDPTAPIFISVSQ